MYLFPEQNFACIVHSCFNEHARSCKPISDYLVDSSDLILFNLSPIRSDANDDLLNYVICKVNLNLLSQFV